MTSSTSPASTRGLLCPDCGSPVPVAEGSRVVACPFCQTRSLVAGDKGIRRWQVPRRIDRTRAAAAVQQFWSGVDRAPRLKGTASLKEIFLVYIPYWRVRAHVAGWIFGRIKKDKLLQPVEVPVYQEMRWNDAATDVAEFGVHRVRVPESQLAPFDSQALHGEAMVFEPTESPDSALAEAEDHFLWQARKIKKLAERHFDRLHLLRPRLSIIYYPLWVARYEHKERNYQVLVDGVTGETLYGKAPGNIFYRAAALAFNMAIGTLIMVNGTVIAFRMLVYFADDDEALALLLLPLALGLGLVAMGYRAFRHGEEIEKQHTKAKKAMLASAPGADEPEGLVDIGRAALEDGTLNRIFK